MLEMEKVLSAICYKVPEGQTFEPSDTPLTDYFPETPKGNEEEPVLVTGEKQEKQEPTPITPKYPLDTQVIAIDTTNFTLGQIPDGLVGAVRASIIVKPAGKTAHSLEHYGPYVVPITNQNKDLIYKGMFKAVHGKETAAQAPDVLKTLDRVRSLLERYLQLHVAKTCKNSLILLDGSLIGSTVGDPKFILESILADAAINGNAVVAISKSTSLTLQHTQRNILSLLDNLYGPCYIGNIKKDITEDPGRYLGEIYVSRLTPLGEPFRIDVPRNAPMTHDAVFSQVAGLAGDYGYPEELKLAHMTCVLSSIELLELQSAAIVLHGLRMKEELRPKIFPL